MNRGIFLVLMVLGFAVGWGLAERVKSALNKPPQRAFVIDSCIAAKTNIEEYKYTPDPTGYPVGRVEVLNEAGYTVVAYIPELNMYGTMTIPYDEEPNFEVVKCPFVLGGGGEM